MRAVVQRFTRASVRVEGETVGEIACGLVVLLGIARDDAQEDAAYLLDKIVGLRVLDDAEGRMNLSVTDVGGGLLVVSRFTLYGDTRKGRRPSFIDAARPELAIPLYERFVALLRATGLPVGTGEFGAMMDVELVNDGPVTLILER